MNSKKISILLLGAFLASALLSSCSMGKTSTTPETTTVTDATTVVSTAEETEAKISDNLPEKDFNGYEFRVITQTPEDMSSGEETGDILNDLVYTRNRTIEERYNMKFVTKAYESTDYLQVTDAINRSVQAGSDEYDMVYVHMVDGSAQASKGYYVALNTLPYMDTTQPWWDKDVKNGFSIENNLYLINGDISPSSLLRSSCMVFNKKLFDKQGLEYPYQLAYDGKWTLDALASLTKDQTADLNGDGQITTESDRFGLSSWYLSSPYSFFYGAGGMLVRKDEKDIPYLDLNVEQFSNIYQKMYEVFIGNQSNFVTDMEIYDTAYGTFSQGRALFSVIALTHLQQGNFREMQDDFGILPCPKYDENQEQYMSFVNGCSSMVGVPITVTDKERAGIILTALAATSYNEITPSLYDVIVKTKNTRDEQSVDMVDLVIRNRVFDIAYANMGSFGEISNFTRDLLAKKSTEVASTIAKSEQIATKALEQLIEAYNTNAGV